MRTEPYTDRGIHQVPCARCGDNSHRQFTWPGDGTFHDDGSTSIQYRGICKSCDIGLNQLVMRYMFGDTREPDIEAYAKRVEGDGGQG